MKRVRKLDKGGNVEYPGCSRLLCHPHPTPERGLLMLGNPCACRKRANEVTGVIRKPAPFLPIPVAHKDCRLNGNLELRTDQRTVDLQHSKVEHQEAIFHILEYINLRTYRKVSAPHIPLTTSPTIQILNASLGVRERPKERTGPKDRPEPNPLSALRGNGLMKVFRPCTRLIRRSDPEQTDFKPATA